MYATFGAGQVRVIDVSTPSSPKEVANINVGGFAIKLEIKDNLLFVTKSDIESHKLQLSLLDISQPECPKLLGSVITESIFGFGGATFAYCFTQPQIIDKYVYVAGINYLDIFEIKNN